MTSPKPSLYSWLCVATSGEFVLVNLVSEIVPFDSGVFVLAAHEVNSRVQISRNPFFELQIDKSALFHFI